MPRDPSSDPYGLEGGTACGGLPPGQRVQWLGSVSSTNDVALAQARQGAGSGLWVAAERQEGGRGRGGRDWSSPPGNLYASHMLRLSCSLAQAQHLTLLAPVALIDAVGGLLRREPGSLSGLRLKWPNDVLIDGAKVSGILLESAVVAATDRAQGQLVIVMGFGLNLASHPPGLDQAATHLAAHGCSVLPKVALAALGHALELWLGVWREGAGFAEVRAGWLERAGPMGEILSVRSAPDPTAPRISGQFAGLDDAGALLLNHEDGSRSRHIQGDVALGAADR